MIIAGGEGITPFIPILRARRGAGTLAGCELVFSNKTEADIILRDEWEAMRADGLGLLLLVTSDENSALPGQRVDAELLANRYPDASDRRFYLCGPPPMMDDVTEALRAVGADADAITLEDDE